jgi:hypothetical protein
MKAVGAARTAAGAMVPAGSTSLDNRRFEQHTPNGKGGTMANKDKGGSKTSKKNAQKSLKEKRKAKKGKKAGR